MYFDVFYISIPSNDKHVEFRVDVPTQEVLDEEVKDYEKISKKKCAAALDQSRFLPGDSCAQCSQLALSLAALLRAPLDMRRRALNFEC